MVEYDDEQVLTELLKACSDSTRRALLRHLCQHGPSRVTDLSKLYEMSLNAVSKHIKVLEKAGLVRRNTMGRTHWIEADLSHVASVEQWFIELQSIWQLRLDKLAQLVEENTHNE